MNTATQHDRHSPDLACRKISHARAMLDTTVSLTTIGLGAGCARRAQGVAFGCLEQLDSALETTNPDSELMKLCAAPVGKPVAVTETLWQLIRLSSELAYRTDGLFDVVATGTGNIARWTDLDLSRRGYVRTRRRVAFDLGGIRKGFAADLAVGALREMGVRCGIVDVGGVVRGFGPQDWRVQFHLKDGGLPLPVPVSESALAGGSGWRLFDTIRGVMHGTPAWDNPRILVRARTAALADGLAKVAMLAPERSINLLPKLGASAVLLTAEGAHSFEYAS